MPQGSLFKRCKDESLPLFNLAKKSAEEKQALFNDKEKQIVKEVLSLVSTEEIGWLSSLVDPLEKDLVISHNDFLNGNILNLPTGELKLIDFEYSTYNFRMYDIANFINETLFDYTLDHHPFFVYAGNHRDSDEDVSCLIKYYILFSKYPENISFERAVELIEDPKQAEAELIQLYGNKESYEKEIEKYLSQIHVGYLLSHYFWIVWAVIMCKNNNVQFGYLDFAIQRYHDYLDLKKKYYNK